MQTEKIEAFLEGIEGWSWEKIGLWAMLFFFSGLVVVLTYQEKLPLDIDHFSFLFFLLLLFALYRPRLSFFALVFFLPFEIINLAPSELGLALRPYQLLTVTTLLAIVLHILGGKMNPKKIHFIGLDALPIGVFMGSVLAIPGALVPAIAFKQALILASFLTLYTVARIFLKSAKVREEALNFFYGGALVVILVAFWQNIQDKYGHVSHMVMAGRPNSTFFEADWLGFFLAGVALLLLGEWVVGTRKKQDTQIEHMALVARWIFFVLTVMVLIMTVSRSAWLAFVVGILMLFVTEGYRVLRGERKWKKYAMKILLAGGLCVIALTLVLLFQLTRFQISERAESTTNGYQNITVACEREASLPKRIESVEELSLYGCRHITLEAIEEEKQVGKSIQEVERRDPNFSIRSQIYQKSWETLKTHFVFGIGLGNSSQFLGLDAQGAGLNTSNLFLETWLASGLLGGLSLFLLWIVLGIRFVYGIVKGSYPERYMLGFALLCGMTIFNLFNAGMFLGSFFFLLALLVTLSNPPADYKFNPPTDHKKV
ncbi:MAG: O-antigen ligase family protein [Candidatus Moranbacteria bacterium]|nr:O-antigen ligase family protein [Candidatus Moranbacteria bacterium]